MDFSFLLLSWKSWWGNRSFLGAGVMSFEERARTHREGRAMQDGGTLAVLVCVPGTAVKPLTLGVELTKLICAWVCRNFLLLFFALLYHSFVIYFICHLLTHMWKSRVLWVNFRKSTKFDSLRRELFSSIPARLWALSSVWRLTTTRWNTSIPPICLSSLATSSPHCPQVSISFGGQEAIYLQIILGADSALLRCA